MANDPDPLLERLRALNLKIEELVIQNRPALEGEIEGLELEAAAIIQARTEARLGPINAAFEQAQATARRLLGEALDA